MIDLKNVAPDAPDADPLEIVESGTHAGRAYAVGQTPTRDLVLVVEKERGVMVDGKRDRSAGTETYWKRTARLADFAAAIECGLIAA